MMKYMWSKTCACHCQSNVQVPPTLEQVKPLNDSAPDLLIRR